MSLTTREAAPSSDLTLEHVVSSARLPEAPAFVPEPLADLPDKVFWGDAAAAENRARLRLRQARKANAEHEPKLRITSSDVAVLDAIFHMTTGTSRVLTRIGYVRKLETLTNLSESTVHRAIRKLTYHGVITWRPHEGARWSRMNDAGLPIGGRNALLSVLTPAELDAYLRNGVTRGKVSRVTPITRTRSPKGINTYVLLAREAKNPGLCPDGPARSERHDHLENTRPTRTENVQAPPLFLAKELPPRSGIPDCPCADDLWSACPKCRDTDHKTALLRAAGRIR